MNFERVHLSLQDVLGNILISKT